MNTIRLQNCYLIDNTMIALNSLWTIHWTKNVDVGDGQIIITTDNFSPECWSCQFSVYHHVAHMFILFQHFISCLMPKSLAYRKNIE